MAAALAGGVQASAEDPIGKFLDAVRAGYGAKFGPVFEGFGLELVEDLKEAPADELKEVEDRLAAAGAGPAHIRKMRQAINALRGEEPPGAPASPAPVPPTAQGSGAAGDAAAPGAQELHPAPAPNPFSDPESPTSAAGGTPPAARCAAAPQEWQECTTNADGMKSYVNTRTGEVRWEAPTRVEIVPSANPFDDQPQARKAVSCDTISTVHEDEPPPTSTAPGRLTATTHEAAVTQALKIQEWAQSAWKATQDGSRPSPDDSAMQRTATGSSVERRWSAAELEAYAKAYAEVNQDPCKAEAYLDRSGLPAKALTEIKRIGCLDIKRFVGPQNFYACCRLVAHCQALEYEDGGFQVVREAGAELKERLPGMLASPPRQMPRFDEVEKP